MRAAGFGMNASASLLGDGKIRGCLKQHVAVNESGSLRVFRILPIPAPASGAFRRP